MALKNWTGFRIIAIVFSFTVIQAHSCNPVHQGVTNCLTDGKTVNRTFILLNDTYLGTIKPCCNGYTGSSDVKFIIVSNNSTKYNSGLHISKSSVGSYGIRMGKNVANISDDLCIINGRNMSQAVLPSAFLREGVSSVYAINLSTSCLPKTSDEKACQGQPNNTFYLQADEGLNISCIMCLSKEEDVINTVINTHIYMSQIINLTTDKVIDASTASKAMKDLSSLVPQMGNSSTAHVKMGEAQGILMRLSSENPSKLIQFAFSSNGNLSVNENPNPSGTMSQISISIPEEAIKKALLLTNGSAFLGVFRFPSMQDEQNSLYFNDEVFAIEMGTNITNLSDTIDLGYSMIKGDSELMCNSWNGEGDKPKWIPDGCKTVVQNDSLTCKCTHLTFFALLMVSSSENISSADLKTLSYITYIGCGTSMFFLSVALLMHFLLRTSKSSKATKILINLFLAMFLLDLSFLSNEWIAGMGNPIACKLIAAFLHYSMLATFNWFAIEAFHLYLQLIKVFNINIKYFMLKAYVVGWALPLVVVVLIFIVGKYDRFTISKEDASSTMCWIVQPAHYLNISYYGAVFLFTLAIFIMVVKNILYLKRKKIGIPKRDEIGKSTFIILALCSLLGVTWGFAFFSYGPLLLPSYYIFTILNSFQGFFLFLYYYNSNQDTGGRVETRFTMKTVSSSLSSRLRL